MQKQYQQTLDESERIGEEGKAVEVFDPHSMQKQLNQVNEELLAIQRYRQLIHQWGLRFLASYFEKTTRKELAKKHPRGTEKQLMLEVLGTVRKFLEELGAKEVTVW